MKANPQLKLYKYENSAFILIAIIDDYQQISFEHSLYSAGTFTITINYNIPNARLFERGLFVQFGDNPHDFGEILTMRNSIGPDGKGSEILNITGYDARYLFKRRIIRNLNANDVWSMTAKGEICLRSLVRSECGDGAEAKRRLPISNVIPEPANAKGGVYSVSESYTNLYDALCTIATQSEIGWAVTFENGALTLEVFEGRDLKDSVFFSTDFESLANGEYTDTAESFANVLYIGGKGEGSEQDMYEGAVTDEGGNEPTSLDRFEAYDSQASMTTEEEYEAEAGSMLSQYSQNVTVSGAGLVKSPFVFRENYDVGDVITLRFSDKTAVTQILSVTEQWSNGSYTLSFSFGKPQNNLAQQISLLLKKISNASKKTKAIECVKWYTIPTDTAQSEADVTFDTLGFTGAMTADTTFTFYLDNEKTGAKSYNIYAKNLSGNYTLTLTTGVSGASNFTIKGGSNIVARILVDENGNIVSQSMTATDTIESGNNQPVTSNVVWKYNQLFFSHNIPRYENGALGKDITAYYNDGTLWKRLNGTDGYSYLEDIYVGDYFQMSRAITCPNSYEGTIGSAWVTIAGINTLQGNGDTVDMMYNHLVMIPGNGEGGSFHFGRQAMNTTYTTTDGYKASRMRTSVLGPVVSAGSTASGATINQQLYAEFGSHFKTTRELITNALNANGVNRFGSASGCSSNWEWSSEQAILMSEVEVYGSTVWSSSGYDTGSAKVQLPLFRYSTKALNNRSSWYWLKDIASAAYFCIVTSNGLANFYGAGFAGVYVRPRFVLAA